MKRSEDLRRHSRRLTAKAKNWNTVLVYAESIKNKSKVACVELQQAVDRFFKDLDSDRYDLRSQAPEFCIQIIEKPYATSRGKSLTEHR